jgi:transposase
MINYLQRWLDPLRWQRLKPFEALALTLLKHLDGIANYCCTKVRMGVVEAVNGICACSSFGAEAIRTCV